MKDCINLSELMRLSCVEKLMHGIKLGYNLYQKAKQVGVIGHNKI